MQRPNRTAALAAAAVSFVGCLAVLAYDGPGRALVRGSLGDVIVVVLIVALLAAVPLGTARSRLIGVGALALGTECFQALHLLDGDSPDLVRLVVGATFDVNDLIAYTIGLVISAGLERAWSRPVGGPGGSTGV